MGGSIDSVFASAPSLAQQIDAGKVRALAITSGKRSERFPAVPTIAESGYPNFDVNPWFGLFAPKGTPAAIVDRMNQEINAVLKTPATASAFDAQGMVPATSSPAEFGSLIARDAKRWDDIVARTGITAE